MNPYTRRNKREKIRNLFVNLGSKTIFPKSCEVYTNYSIKTWTKTQLLIETVSSTLINWQKTRIQE